MERGSTANVSRSNAGIRALEVSSALGKMKELPSYQTRGCDLVIEDGTIAGKRDQAGL